MVLTGLKRVMPQPFIACVLAAMTVLALNTAWRIQGSEGIHLDQALLMVALVLGVLAAYQYPIHVGFRQKVEMTTVPIYLMAVLLPSAALAATTAGIGVLTAELLVRTRRGNYYSDVFTSVCRWALVVLIGAGVASEMRSLGPIYLLVVALVVAIGELLTIPLVIGPVTGENPFAIIADSARDTIGIETAQYLLGMLGAMASQYAVWGVLLLALPTALVYRAFKSAKELQTNTRQILEHMADTVDLRDPYTGGHSRRVTDYTRRILQELNVPGLEADLIIAAARVHDIGKIGVPDSILNKPGRLTAEEQAIMQTHPERGANLLARYPDFARGVEFVRHHHESWDGTGYPHRLKGTDIPFGARVIAVADSYDAMTSDRPYRAALSSEATVAILRQGRGQQWDAEIVDAFLRVMDLPIPAAPLLHLVRPDAVPQAPAAS